MGFVKKELKDEELKDVSGGYLLHRNAWYMVINDADGSVLMDGLDYEDAVNYCLQAGLSPQEIQWYDWIELKNHGSI